MPNEIVVSKDDLLAKLKKNRETHREQFLTAQDGYKAAVIKELEFSLDKARKGQGTGHDLALELYQMPVPQDHTGEYDTEILMLEMHMDSHIEITRKQFENYVQDHWAWSHEFAGTTQMYSA